MERNRWMKRNRMESSSTLSSLREEKLENESERHGTENTPPSFPSSREQRQEKRVKHHGGGLQSEASGLAALSRIISVINSLSFRCFRSIFTLGSPSEMRTCETRVVVSSQRSRWRSATVSGHDHPKSADGFTLDKFVKYLKNQRP